MSWTSVPYETQQDD